MKSLILIAFAVISCKCIAQTKNVKPANEIDRLYQKYKGVDSVEITNPYGTFKADIYVELNKEGKPMEITMSGNVGGTEIEAVKQFIIGLIRQKKANGYHIVGDDYDEGLLNATVALTKGNLYTRILQMDKETEPIYLHNGGYIPAEHYISFSITNGDVKRAAGPKSSKVDF
ncbi:MAG TPA: hypothetical protein VK563_20410 [Puia sp.]|nr:hypothetical protein [Puia sp.]